MRISKSQKICDVEWAPRKTTRINDLTVRNENNELVYPVSQSDEDAWAESLRDKRMSLLQGTVQQIVFDILTNETAIELFPPGDYEVTVSIEDI